MVTSGSIRTADKHFCVIYSPQKHKSVYYLQYAPNLVWLCLVLEL